MTYLYYIIFQEKSWSSTYTIMMCSDEKIFSIRSSYVIGGCENRTAVSLVATTVSFTEEGIFDDACSMKIISISVSLARKSDEETRAGSFLKRYSVALIGKNSTIALKK